MFTRQYDVKYSVHVCYALFNTCIDVFVIVKPAIPSTDFFKKPSVFIAITEISLLKQWSYIQI